MNKRNDSLKDKIRLFALLEPLNIRMSLCFPSDGLVGKIFIELYF